MRFSGKVVVVTGAGPGVGAATARRFARQGASVVLCGRNKEQLDQVAASCGGPALAQPGDVSSPSDMEQLAQATSDRFGRIDVLANNAARAVVGGFLDHGPEEWRKVTEGGIDTAVWRHGGMPVVPIRRVLVRDPLGRLQAPLCTDQEFDPVQVSSWFAHRWLLEVTLRQVRDHLGVEMQLQWSDKAIAPTTLCLHRLFSLVTLPGKEFKPQARRATEASSWYRKQHSTCSDTLAAVRREL